MSEYSRPLKALIEKAVRLNAEKDEIARQLAAVNVQITYLQTLMWTEQTGIPMGAELAPTSSFMREIDARRRTAAHFRHWTRDAHYTLHDVTVREGRETTCGVLCDAGGYTGMLPAWIIQEMRAVWLARQTETEVQID